MANQRQPESRSDRRVRRGVFHVWVGLTIIFALVLAFVLPFIQGDRFAFLSGVPVVILNLVLLIGALGWLVWYVFGAGKTGTPERTTHGANSSDEGARGPGERGMATTASDHVASARR